MQTEGSAPPEKKPATSVKDIGLAFDRNARYRRFMEDAHTVEDAFGGVSDRGFFAVYDGHGGKTAALFCQANLHKILLEELEKRGSDECNEEKMRELFKRVYARTDEAMKESVPSAGACVVTALVERCGEKRWLWVANAGDARAVLCRDGKAVRLSEEHKPDNEAEAERVTRLGAFIKTSGEVKRVNGLVGVTRALGDHMMKQWIISEPYFAAVELREGDTQLVLACDGLWDVIEDQQAVELAAEEPDAQAAARRLLVEALKRGSTDNLSVIVLRL